MLSAVAGGDPNVAVKMSAESSRTNLVEDFMPVSPKVSHAGDWKILESGMQRSPNRQ
jgi:hypothetical protein